MTPSTGERLAGIEGLRALAALSVLLYHGWLYTSPSGSPVDPGPLLRDVFPRLGLGVTLFFTLSGFLLFRPFATAILSGRERPQIGRYLRNRALRILPGYWVVLAVVALGMGAAIVSSSAAATIETGRIDDPSVLVSDALLLQGYRPSTLLTGIGPAWSLAVEAVFYVLLPVLVLVAAALARGRTFGGRVIACLVPPTLLLAVGASGKVAAALLIPGDGVWNTSWNAVVVRSFWAQADLFTYGMVVAVVWALVADGRLTVRRQWRHAAWVGLVFGGLALEWLSRSGRLHISVYENGVALLCAILLALAVVGRSGERRHALVRLLESRPLVVTGVISYSLFLWHEPVARWLAAHGLTLTGADGLWANVLLLLCVSWALAAVTYAYVELPGLRLKGARARLPSSDAQAQAAP